MTWFWLLPLAVASIQGVVLVRSVRLHRLQLKRLEAVAHILACKPCSDRAATLRERRWRADNPTYGMRRCEACGGPGPCLMDPKSHLYACRACHSEPDDVFFKREESEG